MRLNDLQPAKQRPRLQDEHFQKAFELVKDQELDKKEIAELAHDIGETDEYDRTKASAELLLARMHILVHGVAPYGETQKRAEEFLTISQSMVDFANRMGYDTLYNIDHAREELKNRPVRIPRDEAAQLVWDYYRKNKDFLPKTVGQHKEELTDKVASGVSVEDVFKQLS